MCNHCEPTEDGYVYWETPATNTNAYVWEADDLKEEDFVNHFNIIRYILREWDNV